MSTDWVDLVFAGAPATLVAAGLAALVAIKVARNQDAASTKAADQQRELDRQLANEQRAADRQLAEEQREADRALARDERLAHWEEQRHERRVAGALTLFQMLTDAVAALDVVATHPDDDVRIAAQQRALSRWAAFHGLANVIWPEIAFALDLDKIPPPPVRPSESSSTGDAVTDRALLMSFLEEVGRRHRRIHDVLMDAVIRTHSLLADSYPRPSRDARERAEPEA